MNYIKNYIRRIQAHKHYGKGVIWFKRISITGLAQIIVQGIAFISGIIIIRVLPTQEYAFYTLANVFLGTMTIIANAGVSVGVMAEGGKVWQDKEKLGEVLATGFNLRKVFSILSLLFGIPILVYLLIKNNASLLTALLIALALIPAFIASLSNLLLVIVPKLHQDILPFQKNEVGVNLGRLCLLCLSIFIFPLAYLVILSSSIAQVIGNRKLRKIAEKHVDLSQEPSPIVKKNILKVVKRILPDAIYYSLSGQITIWLLSVFGSTTSLAEIGALGRLAMMLTLISILFNTLLEPRFSRSVADFKKLLNMYVGAQVVLGVFLTIIVGFVALFSKEILWVLGEKYAHLNYEIVLAIIGSSLNVFIGAIYGLNSSRGWIIHPALYIGFNMSVLVGGIFFLDISSLQGVLWLNILVASMQLLINNLYGFYELFKLKNKKII